MPAICRSCDAIVTSTVCGACGGARIIRHEALFALTIGHIDCDAFYASVEKRDRPELRDVPVIVGGGARGVVTTCCYVARLYGVCSAMPMFKAKALCPQAVIIRPQMAKYVAVSRQIRTLMETLTPLVQPLSIDEAVLDLAGTQSLHGAPPAVVLNRFARLVEREVGVTVSIGLAANRLLAKLAAERGKPRGFFVFGPEAPGLLAAEPVGILPGIGPAMVKRLAGLGITSVGQLAALDDREAGRRLGEEGPHLAARARGEDTRPVRIDRESKSISAETTFALDLRDGPALEAELWTLCEKLAQRLKAEGQAAGGVVLKLKTASFASRTRQLRLSQPSLLPETIFDAARTLLQRELDGTAFRLIGVGASPLAPAAEADQADLADAGLPRRLARQAAIDSLRTKFGEAAIQRGRSLRKNPPPK
jgi:DNA polymerase-4